MLARRSRPRRGATAVEAALLLGIFLMFVFGVLEYARYLLAVQVATNAARDASRYAAVNLAEPADFDVNDADGKMSIKHYTLDRLGGLAGMITPPGGTPDGMIDVFPCDAAKLYGDPPVIAPKAGWGPDPTSRAVPWNQATFSERVAVRITGTYRPVLPTFLWLDGDIPVRVAAVAGGEG